MDSEYPIPMAGSTISTSTSISTNIMSSPPVLTLEVSLISAQDLNPISKSTRSYAVAWINPNQKLTTGTDHHCTNPTWNGKLTFRLDGQTLASTNSAIHVEIYTVTWFRHALVGTVKVLITDILGPLHQHRKNTRFVALQVRKPSGTPQGILNMGVTLLDNSLKSMLLKHQKEEHPHKNVQHKDQKQEGEKGKPAGKAHLRRSLSMDSDMNNSDDQFPLKEGSVCSGSVVNGSEVCSDVGPSASIVAADIARKMHLLPPPTKNVTYKSTQHEETGSSIVEDLTYEEAMAKGYRTKTTRRRQSWKKAAQYDFDESELSYMSNRHTRRNSDGSLLSCLVGGVEFTIVCGGSNKPNTNKYSNSNMMSRRKNELSSDVSG